MNDETTETTQSTALTTGGQSKRMMDLTPRSFKDALQLSQILADSNLVPKDYVGKPGNVLVAMQMGAEVGLSPMQAIQNIAVINGRPSMWGDAVIALVRASSRCEYIREEFDEASMTATCRGKRRGDEKEYVVRFSQKDAQDAGLWGKAGPWTQYKKRMLQMRARSWVCRDLFADVLKGIQVAEEVMDIIDVTPGAPAAAPAKSRTTSMSEIAARGAEKAQEGARPSEPAPEPDPSQFTLAEVLEGIQGAESEELLQEWAAAAGALGEDEKTEARKAYKTRLMELQMQAHGINPNEGAENDGQHQRSDDGTEAGQEENFPGGHQERQPESG